MTDSSDDSTKLKLPNGFMVGEWLVIPKSNMLKRPSEEHRLEAKVMEVLTTLASQPGSTLSKEEILNRVWPDTFVGESVLYRSISELRRILEVNPRQPRIIETVPRKGYCLAASALQISDQSRPSIPDGSIPVKTAFRERPRWVSPALALLALIPAAVLVFWIFMGSPFRGPPPPTERTWILVLPFENETGEEALSGSLEYALEQQLVTFRNLSPVGPDRVADALRLMRKPPETTLDLETGREVCLRDGQIPFLLASRVDKLGDTYLISARLVEADSGEILDTYSGEARNQGEILGRIEELSFWTAGTFGRATRVVEESRPLEQVTTRSLEALSLFSQAVRAFRLEGSMDARNRIRYQTAEKLLRQAIEEDPEFASAYLLLSYCTFFQRNLEEAWAPLERAFQLSGQVSGAEQAFIRGSYYMWNGQREGNPFSIAPHPEDDRELLEKAVTEYLVAFDLQPSHNWAASNLARVYQILGRFADARPVIVEAALVRPNSLATQWRAAAFFLDGFGSSEEARRFVDRGRTLLAENPFLDPAVTDRLFRPFPIWERWFDDDVEGALEEADQLRETLESKRDSSPSSVRGVVAHLSLMYATLGQVKRARQVSEDFQGARSSGSPAVLSFLDSDVDKLRPRRGRSSSATNEMVLMKLAPEEIELVEEDPNRFRCAGSVELIQGEKALLTGEFRRAAELLGQGIQMIEASCFQKSGQNFYGRLERAEAYLGLGDTEAAIRDLEWISRNRQWTFPSNGPFWLEARYRLSEIYSQVGRQKEADAILEHLRVLLDLADPDHPILVRLESTN